jgi:hypothetical protein
MKLFYFKLLLFQTIFYALFFCIVYTNSLTNNGELLWKPMVITFYSISVLITFVIPIIEELRKKN